MAAFYAGGRSAIAFEGPELSESSASPEHAHAEGIDRLDKNHTVIRLDKPIKKPQAPRWVRRVTQTEQAYLIGRRHLECLPPECIGARVIEVEEYWRANRLGLPKSTGFIRT
jgi:hypothetical protein